MNAVKSRFKDQAPHVEPIIKKVFGNFRQFVDYRSYCNHVVKFISSDIAACKEIFFGYCDQNKDKKVCETDLFNLIKSIQTFESSNLLMEDILTIKKEIDSLRKLAGKDDHLQIKNMSVNENVNNAMSKNIQIRKTDNTEEVKEFLREVVSHQTRIKKQQDSVLNPLEKQDPEESLYTQEEVIIPQAMKPFLSREINF